jgi:opine dehydrogenase
MGSSEPIAVLGAGNGGHCMAADLSLAGRDVRLCELPEFAAGLESVLDGRVIRMTGVGRTGDAAIAEVTLCVEEAVGACELVNLVVPAFGQAGFFDELIPQLRDGQTVVLWAGNYGSLQFRELLAERRPELSVSIVETNTLPYGTRLVGPGHVHLSLAAPQVLAATLPGDGDGDVDGRAFRLLRELWPCIVPGHDVLSVALSNPNPVIHPPGALLNVGRIQYSGGTFNMYREGITEAVARVIRQVYGEVQSVATALGTQVIEYEERDFRTKVSIMGVAFQAPFDTIGVIGDIAGPKSIHDRYITEDLPFGLVPVAQLGDRVGVATPLIDSIITLGSSVCGRDFWSEGRGLEALGLAGLPPDRIIASVRGTDGLTAPTPAAVDGQVAWP